MAMWVPLGAGAPLAPAPVVDVVIRNGRVIDPETSTDAIRSVAVNDGRIVAIGSPDAVPAGRLEIDATGLVVAPGFVDILAAIGPQEEGQRYKVCDGVTTVLNMHGGPVDLPAYFREFTDRGGSHVHYGTTVGHSRLRTRARALDPYRPATPEQIARMKELAAAAIRQGAIGIGFGINYVPGSSFQEVLALYEVAAEHGVPCHVHSRYKGSVFPESIVAALQEIITASAVTGASTQIVHLASSAVGSMETCLKMIEGARRSGIDIAADVYPYLANSTNLASALYDPGWEERFGGISYEQIQLVETGERLTEETFQKYRQTGALVITHFIPEAELVAALRKPFVMVASDGVIRDGKGHPRGAGAFARFLGHFVRDEEILSLADGLRKITLLPVQRLEPAVPGLKRKGRLQVGCDADVTIFDPATIRDRATYTDPARYSEGIVHVLVAGQVVVEAGKLKPEVKPGQPIRHDSR